jgi:hypothetical protein
LYECPFVALRWAQTVGDIVLVAFAVHYVGSQRCCGKSTTCRISKHVLILTIRNYINVIT